MSSDTTSGPNVPHLQQSANPVVLRPNMLLVQADLASSTIKCVSHDHSVMTENRYLNCLFHDCNFEGSSFIGCEFDASLIENSSLRGVELRNCDVEGLVINGFKINELIYNATEGRKRHV